MYCIYINVLTEYYKLHEYMYIIHSKTQIYVFW